MSLHKSRHPKSWLTWPDSGLYPARQNVKPSMRPRHSVPPPSSASIREFCVFPSPESSEILNNNNTVPSAGGDDVQQLCDAGEEEFLEIMALVGMASKPLHVRRLQKALQEWLTNPCKVPPARYVVLSPENFGSVARPAECPLPSLRELLPRQLRRPRPT